MPLHPLGYEARAQHLRHRPPRASSALLATRAWVQYILNFCDDVVQGRTAPLDVWNALLTPDQRNVLKRRLRDATLAVNVRPRSRTPKDLDVLWSEMRDQAASKGTGTEPVFGTRYAYGRHTPSQEVQDLFARVVPHSSKLLLEPPIPFDPLLYDALDFQNVLAGRALLLRVIAPWEVESHDGYVAVHGDDEGQADVDAALGGDARKELPPLGYDTYTTLCGEVVEAAACALYPVESSHPEGRRDMVDRLLSNTNRLVAVCPLTITEATRILTDSLAAYRLSILLGSDPPDVGVPEIHTQSQRIAAKWLRASLKALTEHPDFDEQDRSAFYRPPRSKMTALEEALKSVNCWYPNVP